jgi:hypothetical protein
MLETIEHIMKKWEIDYGYIHVGIHPEWREFFESVIDKRFDLDVFGVKKRQRKIGYLNRIYVSPRVLKGLKPGETVLIVKDEKGEFYVKRKK